MDEVFGEIGLVMKPRFQWITWVAVGENDGKQIRNDAGEALTTASLSVRKLTRLSSRSPLIWHAGYAKSTSLYILRS